MKRVSLFGLFLLLLLPFQVNALTGSLTMDCHKSTVKPGDTITCDLTGTSDAIVNGVEVKVAISSNASRESFTKTNNNWRDASFGRDGVTLGAYADEPDISGSFDVGKLILEIDDNATGIVTIGLSEPKFVDADYVEITNGITVKGASLTVDIPKPAEPSVPATPPSSAPASKPSEPPAKPSEPSVSKNEAPSQPSTKNEAENEKPEGVVTLVLDDILIDGYEIDFEPTELNYTLEIADETTLNILPVTNNSDINYVVEGNENLRDGSIIYITLRSDRDSSLMTSYMLNIKKSKVDTVVDTSGDDKNIGRIVLIVIIIILVIVNIVRLSLNLKKVETKENS